MHVNRKRRRKQMRIKNKDTASPDKSARKGRTSIAVVFAAFDFRTSGIILSLTTRARGLLPLWDHYIIKRSLSRGIRLHVHIVHVTQFANRDTKRLLCCPVILASRVYILYTYTVFIRVHYSKQSATTNEY